MGRFFSLEIVLVVFMFIGDAKLCVFSISSNSSTSYLCHNGDRETLLKFQKSVRDTFLKLYSWDNTTDCCKWKGIGCDTKTGRVVKLDLGIGPVHYAPLFLGYMSSCLVQLKYLEYLDLSYSSFFYDYDHIPEFFRHIERLGYLRFLNLSGTDIGVFIPPQLGNLTNLEVLDLSYIGHFMDDLRWMSRLSYLKQLEIRGNNLNGALNLWQELSVLPSLSVLGLSDCSLNDTHFSAPRINSTFLSIIQELYIDKNKFTGPFPSFLENMTSLRVLDISGDTHLPFVEDFNIHTKHLPKDYHFNSFVNASIPLWLRNLKSLEHLDLSINNFVTVEGGLSRMLQSLCHLKSLYLYQNKFQESFETNKDGSSVCMDGYDLEILNIADSGLKGYFPEWLGQYNKLTELDLSNNMLSGHITASIGNLQALKVLHLSNNKLNGTIPATIGNLLALTYLNVSHNQLNGDVPESIGQLSSLKNIDLSSNLLQGEISEIHLINLSMLKELRLGSNQLSINIRPNWVPPFQLTDLDMGSCKIIGTVFPQWLESQNQLERLLVSNASIYGLLPKWFQGWPLWFLDLSHNQITGSIPQNIGIAFPTLAVVQLSHNMFIGPIPSSSCKIDNLTILDLSDNMLSGDIPNCWSWSGRGAISTIRLSSNKLTGVIPSSFGNLTFLSWLHLNNNGLKGDIPRSLNGTQLVILNIGENRLSGNVPEWIGTDMPSLQILRLRKNMFDGHVPQQLCSLKSLQILDLAGNNLIGTIPPCLGNLTGMMVKYSEKRFFKNSDKYWLDNWEGEKIEVVMKAKDIEYEKILQLVVNLDLSSNKLVGTIPNELSHLIELLSLNLSYNHLTGHIPNNIGDMKSLMSLDLSNNQLYGNIPTSVSDLTSLAYLNLSQNNFSGKIPSGPQLQTLEDPSIYMGNPKLCGDPLPKRCPGDESFQVPLPATSHDENIEEDDDYKSKKIWFYVATTLGYAIGLWAVIGTLMLKKDWRYVLFRFADETVDWIYVTIVINYRKLKKMMMWG